MLTTTPRPLRAKLLAPEVWSGPPQLVHRSSSPTKSRSSSPSSQPNPRSATCSPNPEKRRPPPPLRGFSSTSPPRSPTAAPLKQSPSRGRIVIPPSPRSTKLSMASIEINNKTLIKTQEEAPQKRDGSGSPPPSYDRLVGNGSPPRGLIVRTVSPPTFRVSPNSDRSESGSRSPRQSAAMAATSTNARRRGFANESSALLSTKDFPLVQKAAGSTRAADTKFDSSSSNASEANSSSAAFGGDGPFYTSPAFMGRSPTRRSSPERGGNSVSSSSKSVSFHDASRHLVSTPLTRPQEGSPPRRPSSPRDPEGRTRSPPPPLPESARRRMDELARSRQLVPRRFPSSQEVRAALYESNSTNSGYDAGRTDIRRGATPTRYTPNMSIAVYTDKQQRESKTKKLLLDEEGDGRRLNAPSPTPQSVSFARKSAVKANTGADIEELRAAEEKRRTKAAEYFASQPPRLRIETSEITEGENTIQTTSRAVERTRPVLSLAVAPPTRIKSDVEKAEELRSKKKGFFARLLSQDGRAEIGAGRMTSDDASDAFDVPVAGQRDNDLAFHLTTTTTHARSPRLSSLAGFDSGVRRMSGRERDFVDVISTSRTLTTRDFDTSRVPFAVPAQTSFSEEEERAHERSKQLPIRMNDLKQTNIVLSPRVQVRSGKDNIELSQVHGVGDRVASAPSEHLLFYSSGRSSEFPAKRADLPDQLASSKGSPSKREASPQKKEREPPITAYAYKYIDPNGIERLKLVPPPQSSPPRSPLLLISHPLHCSFPHHSAVEPPSQTRKGAEEKAVERTVASPKSRPVTPTRRATLSGGSGAVREDGEKRGEWVTLRSVASPQRPKPQSRALPKPDEGPFADDSITITHDGLVVAAQKYRESLRSGRKLSITTDDEHTKIDQGALHQQQSSLSAAGELIMAPIPDSNPSPLRYGLSKPLSTMTVALAHDESLSGIASDLSSLVVSHGMTVADQVLAARALKVDADHQARRATEEQVRGVVGSVLSAHTKSGRPRGGADTYPLFSPAVVCSPCPPSDLLRTEASSLWLESNVSGIEAARYQSIDRGHAVEGALGSGSPPSFYAASSDADASMMWHAERIRRKEQAARGARDAATEFRPTTSVTGGRYAPTMYSRSDGGKEWATVFPSSSPSVTAFDQIQSSIVNKKADLYTRRLRLEGLL